MVLAIGARTSKIGPRSSRYPPGSWSIFRDRSFQTLIRLSRHWIRWTLAKKQWIEQWKLNLAKQWNEQPYEQPNKQRFKQPFSQYFKQPFKQRNKQTFGQQNSSVLNNGSNNEINNGMNNGLNNGSAPVVRTMCKPLFIRLFMSLFKNHCLFCSEGSRFWRPLLLQGLRVRI